MRAYFKAHGEGKALSIADSVRCLPERVDRLVLAGESGVDYLRERSRHLKDGRFCKAETIVFISPPFPPSAIPESLRRVSNVLLVIGEFAARLEPRYDNPPSFVRIIPRTGLYVPDWMSLAFGR